jgi:curved DNA-binding protein CbpA
LAEPITRDAYAILGVTPDSADQAITAAYRALARRYHPDIAGETTTDRMIRVNAAYERLRTPERRAEYDLELERNGMPRSRPANGRPSWVSDAWADAATNPIGGAPRWRPETDGTGGAGPPPGRPSGSVLSFGRHIGWSIGEIARADPGYLVWLEDRREGRPYREEIDRILRAIGRRSEPDPTPDRGGRRRR